MSDEPEQSLEALERVNGRMVSHWFASMLFVVARNHPDELRAALSEAFDLEAVEEMVTRIVNVANAAQKEADTAAANVRALVPEIHESLDRLEKRMDAMTDYQQRLVEWLKRHSGEFNRNALRVVK
jgi:hypothetical protein